MAGTASLDTVQLDIGHAIGCSSSSRTVKDNVVHGGLTGCCSVLSDVIRMRRSLTEVRIRLARDSPNGLVFHA